MDLVVAGTRHAVLMVESKPCNSRNIDAGRRGVPAIAQSQIAINAIHGIGAERWQTGVGFQPEGQRRNPSSQGVAALAEGQTRSPTKSPPSGTRPAATPYAAR